MFARNSSTRILDKVNLLVAEMRHLRSVGPHFRIVHRLRMPGVTGCLPGEEVFAVFLVYRGAEYQLKLPLALRLLFDYLARHSHVAQSARQIEFGIRADDFYKHHAKNANGRAALTRRIPRSAVREYIKRLHYSFVLAFQEAGVSIDPRKVLIVQETVGNESGYQLKATCSWAHINLNSRESRPLSGRITRDSRE